jgi:hypothetical protein
MGLNKQIKDGRGVTTNYHRVSQFIVDSNNEKVNVIVDSYADEEFRQTEQTNKAARIAFAQMHATLNELMDKNEDGCYTEEIQELTHQINEMNDVQDNEINMVVNSTEFIFEYDPEADYSLKGIYNKLKELEIFKDCDNDQVIE